MVTIAPGITVNGVHISPDQINTEVQYHPASNLLDAKYNAMKALVIRELLIQRVVELGLCTREECLKNVDEVFETLFEKEIQTPVPDEQTCRLYYENNKSRFLTSPLFQVSHILYLAHPEDEERVELMRNKAVETIKRLKEKPELFAEIARAESQCSSAKEDGNLGQIGRGQTLPAFEAALLSIKKGETSAEPVQTSVGFHVIRVHERVEGQQLPFSAVMEGISTYLREKSWATAFNQYIQVLAGRSSLSGFRLAATESPLVQ